MYSVCLCPRSCTWTNIKISSSCWGKKALPSSIICLHQSEVVLMGIFLLKSTFVYVRRMHTHMKISLYAFPLKHDHCNLVLESLCHKAVIRVTSI